MRRYCGENARNSLGTLFLVVVMLVGLMVMTSGCRGAAPANTEATDPVVEPTDPDDAPVSAEDQATPTVETAQEIDYCLDCHSNEEQLKTVANPVEVVESESSGEG